MRRSLAILGAVLVALTWSVLSTSAVPFSSVAPSAFSLSETQGLLDVSGLGITSLAAGDLERYASAGLKSINLARNNLTGIPDGFWTSTCCTQLEAIDLSSNQLVDGQQALSNAKWGAIWTNDNHFLKSLLLNNNPLGAIPDDFLFHVPTVLGRRLPVLSLANTGLTSLGPGSQNLNGPYAYSALNLDGNDLGAFSEATAVSNSALSTYNVSSPFFIPSMGQHFQALSVSSFSCSGCSLRRWTPSFQFATWNSELDDIGYPIWEVRVNLHGNRINSQELNHLTEYLQTLSLTTVMKHYLTLSSNLITSIRPQQFAGLVLLELILDGNPMGGAGALVAGSLSGINLVTGPSGLPGDAASFTSSDGSTVTMPQLYTVQIDSYYVDYRYYWSESKVSLQNCGLTSLPTNLFLWSSSSFAIKDNEPARAGGSWLTTFDASNNPLSAANAWPVGLFGGLWQSDSWDYYAYYYYPLSVLCRNCSLTRLPAGWIAGDDGVGNLGSKMLGRIDLRENNFGRAGIDRMALRSLYPVEEYNSQYFHYHSLKIFLSRSNLTQLQDGMFGDSHLQLLDLSYNDLSSETAIPQAVFRELGLVQNCRITLVLTGCNITTLQPYGFKGTRFSSGPLDFSGQNLINLKEYAFAMIGLAPQAIELLNVSNSNVRYVPDFLLWGSRIDSADFSFNPMRAATLDAFITPSTLDVPFPPPDNYPTACQYTGALTTDWVMGNRSAGGLAPFAFATSVTAGSRTMQIGMLNLSYCGIRQVTRWSVMEGDCAIRVLDLTGNDLSAPTALTSPTSNPACMVGTSSGNRAAIATGLFRELYLSNSNLTILPAGVFSGLNAAPPSGGYFSDELQLFLDHNSNLTIEAGAFDGMMAPEGVLSVDLSYCGLTGASMPPSLFSRMSSQAVVAQLILNGNSFGNGTGLKEALRGAPFPYGGLLYLENAGLTHLPPEAFPIAYPNQLSPYLNVLDLGGNQFDRGVIAERAFALPKGAEGVRMRIRQIFLNDARLRSTSLAPGCFDDVDVQYALFFTNQIADVGDLAEAANYFDPFPEGVLSPSKNGNVTTTVLPNLARIYIGGVVSLPYALLGQRTAGPSVNRFSLEIHFHPNARADVAILKALTYPNQTEPAPAELMKIFSLTLTGCNLTLPQEASNSVAPAISAADSALLTTMCSRSDLGRCFLTPHTLSLALTSQFMTRTFLSHFGATQDWPIEERLSNLVVIRPTITQPYPALFGPGAYDFTLDRIPWEATLTALPKDLLCSLHDLTAFTINYGGYVRGRSSSLKPPVVTTLPSGFFECLAQEEGGSLDTIDLRDSYFRDEQQLYLAGLTSAHLTIQLDLSTLYSPTTFLPLGMFEDLDASAIVLGQTNAVLQQNCANPVGVKQCAACPRGRYSAIFKSAGMSLSLNFCKSCPSGSYCSSAVVYGSRPRACQAGTYQPDTGSTACIPCAAGTYNSVVGQASPAACIACLPGRFSAQIGAPSKSACSDCEPGRYSAGGATECVDCIVGTFQPQSGQPSCLRCPANFYSNAIAAVDQTTCIACPPQTTSSPGSTTREQCLAPTCLNGYYRSSGSLLCDALCSPGQYCVGDGLARACPAGTWQPGSGQAACLSCAAGLYSSEVGAVSPATCRPCPVATFSSVSGASSCQSCPANMLGTVTGATSNSSCVVCPPSSTCAIGTTTPQDLTLLADQSGLTAFASADAFLASYLPSRASRSLRASVPGLDTDETRARIGADANNGQADPTGTLPSSSGRLLSDYQNSLIIVALSVMCIVPLLFFRCIPDGLARWSDAFAILILPNPRRGAKLDTRKSSWGSAFTIAFVPLACLVAFLLATEANVIVTSSLIPAASNDQSGKAVTTLQVTLATYSSPNSNGGAAGAEEWCSPATFTHTVGFNPSPTARAVYSAETGTCTIAVDCTECEMAGVGRLTIEVPYTNQLLEWEVLSTGGIPNSWTRLTAPLAQLPGEMLDASAQLSFSALESFYDDERAGRTSASGVQLAFQNYHRVQAQDPNQLTAASTVSLEFVLNKSDLIYSTTVSPRSSVFGLITTILAVIVSCFGLWSALYRFTVDRAHRAGFVNFEATLTREDTLASLKKDAALKRDPTLTEIEMVENPAVLTQRAKADSNLDSWTSASSRPVEKLKLRGSILGPQALPSDFHEDEDEEDAEAVEEPSRLEEIRSEGVRADDVELGERSVLGSVPSPTAAVSSPPSARFSMERRYDARRGAGHGGAGQQMSASMVDELKDRLARQRGQTEQLEM